MKRVKDRLRNKLKSLTVPKESLQNGCFSKSIGNRKKRKKKVVAAIVKASAAEVEVEEVQIAKMRISRALARFFSFRDMIYHRLKRNQAWAQMIPRDLCSPSSFMTSP